MSRAELLKSITNDDERIIYARVLDRAYAAQKSYTPQFSDFLDPYKLSVITPIAEKEFLGELNIMVWGGFDEAERRKIGFFPQYTEAERNSFPIRCIKVSYNGKFSRELTHRDFLGSVLGLGITREKSGDILIEDEAAYIFADNEVADFICVNLERVGHTKVNVSLLDSYSRPAKAGVEKRITLTSLRIDALLSGAFNLARGKTADLIKGEKAFINWVPVTSVSKPVNEGDTVTLRGHGRVVLKEIQGVTKKDRVAVLLEIFR